MVSLGLSGMGEIGYVNISILAKFGVNISDLRREFAHMSHYQDLWLDHGRVDSENGTNRECTSLSRTILALSNQVLVHIIDWHGYKRDSNCLNFRRLNEAKLLSNTAN